MEPDTDEVNNETPLTPIQQSVANALAAGCTLTNAAAQFGVHRVTVYRWLKTRKEFAAAVRAARNEFVLARRDDLFHLSNRALETLLAILDNPRSSPSVLIKTAVFILTRPQAPKTGWAMPEPSPKPTDKKLIDSAMLEQDYDSLPGLYDAERNAPSEEEIRAESAAAAAPPPRPNASARNTMQREAPLQQAVLHSCPLPANVYLARAGRQDYLDFCENIQKLEAITIADLKKKQNRSETEPETEDEAEDIPA